MRRSHGLGTLALVILISLGIYFISKDVFSFIRNLFRPRISAIEALQKEAQESNIVGVIAVCETPIYTGLTIDEDNAVSGTLAYAKMPSGEVRKAYTGTRFKPLGSNVKISYTQQGEVLIPVLFPDEQGKFIMSKTVWWIVFADTTLSNRRQSSYTDCAKVLKKASGQDLQTALSELRISAPSLRLFEGGSGELGNYKYGSKNYSASFPQSKTRYIYYELTLSHSKRNSPYGVKVPINVVWYRPPASSAEDEIMTQSLEAYVDPAWSTSYQTGYHGSDGDWRWRPGTYKLVVYINGRKAITRSFEIYQDEPEEPTPTPTPSPTPKGLTLSDLNGEVAQLKFFEADEKWTTSGGRISYQSQFPQSEARFIYWEVGLSYKTKQLSDIFLPVEARWYSESSQQLIWQQTTDANIRRLSDYVTVSYGCGWNQPGSWKTGMYRVDIYIGGERVVSGNFKIY